MSAVTSCPDEHDRFPVLVLFTSAGTCGTLYKISYIRRDSPPSQRTRNCALPAFSLAITRLLSDNGNKECVDILSSAAYGAGAIDKPPIGKGWIITCEPGRIEYKLDEAEELIEMADYLDSKMVDTERCV